MIRIVNICLAIVSMVALVGVYAQKHISETTAEEVVRLERAIEDKQEQLSILRADWAYLNQPNHIQALVRPHNEVLGMQVAQVRQFVTFDDLPMRPQMRLDTQALDDLFETIEAGEDPIGSLLEGLL